MGFTNNVVDGNIILAAWGNEIRDRTFQVFATVAERDAQWPAPPNGAICVTLDSNLRWQRVAGAWVATSTSGAVVLSGYAQAIDLGPYATGGVRDVLSVNPGGALPYVTYMQIDMAMQWGADQGAMTGGGDMQRIADGSISPLSRKPIATTGAGKWAAMSAHWRFTVAANQGADYKCRFDNITPAGNSYMCVTTNWLRIMV